MIGQDIMIKSEEALLVEYGELGMKLEPSEKGGSFGLRSPTPYLLRHVGSENLLH